MTEDPGAPETTAPDQEKSEDSQTPSQPGVTTPDPDQDQVMPDPNKDPKLGKPTQPGVTTPRVAPLPVPGQKPDQPAAVAPNKPGEAKPDEEKSDRPGEPEIPELDRDEGSVPGQPGAQQQRVEPAKPRWQPQQLEAAPPAPVIEMQGPHAEVGANVNGGTALPGYLANTHHFTNQDGYVGTVGYRTPTGQGEAGVSVEFLGPNSVKFTGYTGGEGLQDNKSEATVDTTQLNVAKAAVEGWIRQQPGGAAALEAAAQVKIPLEPGGVEPQTFEVGGVTTQWGGSLEY
ncbi:hypothetical protein [Nocardia callitridis]|uniref:hypothetical protein n=1 Tax=Nocardia callitridis TaxID=648753 RepID=UPI0031EEAA97